MEITNHSMSTWSPVTHMLLLLVGDLSWLSGTSLRTSNTVPRYILRPPFGQQLRLSLAVSACNSCKADTVTIRLTIILSDDRSAHGDCGGG